MFWWIATITDGGRTVFLRIQANCAASAKVLAEKKMAEVATSHFGPFVNVDNLSYDIHPTHKVKAS